MKVIIIDGNEVLLDDYDWLRLCRYKWRRLGGTASHNCNYIVAKKRFKDGTRRTIYLHRAVMCPPYGFDLDSSQEVHHKDSSPFNNMRDNLEIMSSVQHGKITRVKNA